MESPSRSAVATVRAASSSCAGCERHHQATGRLVVAVDAALGHERQHLGDVLLADPGQSARLVLSEVLDRETVAVIDGLRQHARVAAARAVRRDTLLDDGDLGRRVERLQRQRRPEPGEPGAHHDDIGGLAPLQRDDVARRTARQPVARLLDRLKRLFERRGQAVATRAGASLPRCCHRTVAPRRMRLARRMAVARTLICGGNAARRAP